MKAVLEKYIIVIGRFRVAFAVINSDIYGSLERYAIAA